MRSLTLSNEAKASSGSQRLPTPRQRLKKLLNGHSDERIGIYAEGVYLLDEVLAHAWDRWDTR